MHSKSSSKMSNQTVQLKHANLPEQIVEVLRKEIFTGEIKPGENLASERELAERFGTSRVTMRKALASLAQEGWIEIVHGRGNTVLDFTQSVGIEVLPHLLLSCPEAVVRPELFEIIIDFSSWLYSKIHQTAARKAVGQDRETLMSLLNEHRKGESVSRFWENDFALIDELLRIGGNILLQMYFNSQKQFIREAIKLGMIKKIPFSLSAYISLNTSFVEAICENDPGKVKRIFNDTADALNQAYYRFFEFASIEGGEKANKED